MFVVQKSVGLLVKLAHPLEVNRSTRDDNTNFLTNCNELYVFIGYEREWVSELEYLKGAQKQKVTMRRSVT